MFLKRIEIYGFKSFAQRSVLDFDYNKKSNITAVVGPNGSGKSNVADAIRWVTGEQSSKNLRSKKSEDVIFCGSSAKAKSSYAEVSILLSDDKPVKFEINNKQHELAEVEVSRKLYRSGVSEYLINHKKVRLSDVQQLFASLGFGQSSYTVIGQGMVDRLLFFTASERKVLFDEAAGVKQYEMKREQSLRKLESTDANLIRLKDILTELEPRVTNLRRLVKRAEGRKEFEAELVAAQQAYYGSLKSEYDSLSLKSGKERAELLGKIDSLDAQISSLQVKIGTKRDNPHTKERRDLESKISLCAGERDSLMREVSYLSGQVESLGRNHQLAVSKGSELTAEKKSLTERITLLGSKLLTERKNLDVARTLEAKLKLPVEELGLAMKEVEEELRRPVDDKTSRIDDLRATISSLSSKLLASEEATARLVELRGLEKTLKDEIKHTKSEQSRIQAGADKLQSKLASLELEVRNLSSLVNPSTLASLEEDMVSLESHKGDAKDFKSKLNKLFFQFRLISKSINNEERDRLEKDISELRSSNNKVSAELVEIAVLLATKESRLGQVLTDIDYNEAKVVPNSKGDTDITKLQEELSRYEGSASERQNVLLREKDELSGRLSEAREALHAAQLENNRAGSVAAGLESELERAKKRLSYVVISLEQLQSGQKSNDKELEIKLAKSEKSLNRKEEDIAKYRGGLTQIVAAERQFEDAGISFEREKRRLLDEKNSVQSLLSRLEVELAKTQVRLEDVNEEIRVCNISIDPDKKYEYLDQMERDVMKLKIENLRRKLDTIGGVDPETEAEYNELEERASEMATQVADLTGAKADLEKVVTELDERIRRQFSDVFKQISGEFSRYFSMLFNGGTADLRLGEDEEGKFGIEITANPPGKRVQSLTALSGGERTLTSLALLFAILSVNPSPFVVLDEVDAALDESNTTRFIKILADLAHKTQFIIISHNRDTMKVASSLYGVTMNDEHVSKLISVKLTEALVGANS